MVAREGFVYEQKPLSVTRNVVIWEGWSLVRVVVRQGFYCTTKIDEHVCPPNISETVAVTIMTLAHRPRIASTMIKLSSKSILLSVLSILLNKIQPISVGPKANQSCGAETLSQFFCFRWFGKLRSFPFRGHNARRCCFQRQWGSAAGRCSTRRYATPSSICIRTSMASSVAPSVITRATPSVYTTHSHQRRPTTRRNSTCCSWRQPTGRCISSRPGGGLYLSSTYKAHR